ncbi:hypothetical protein, partial [Escherichia coli]|uniref:hypothetical protein n=1 Tax=Escherichia coli TaxID=562 RepID=UPI00265C56F8
MGQTFASDRKKKRPCTRLGRGRLHPSGRASENAEHATVGTVGYSAFFHYQWIEKKLNHPLEGRSVLSVESHLA